MVPLTQLALGSSYLVCCAYYQQAIIMRLLDCTFKHLLVRGHLRNAARFLIESSNFLAFKGVRGKSLIPS